MFHFESQKIVNVLPNSIDNTAVVTNCQQFVVRYNYQFATPPPPFLLLSAQFETHKKTTHELIIRNINVHYLQRIPLTDTDSTVFDELNYRKSNHKNQFDDKDNDVELRPSNIHE